MQGAGLVRWGLGVALAVGLGACTVGPPTELRPDGGAMDGGGDGSGPDEPPPMPDVEPPAIGPIPTTTYWPQVPVHGTGPLGGTVVLESPAGGAQIVTLGASGAFCVDVPLVADALNTITLRGVDAVGSLSDTIERQVRQQGKPPGAPVATPAHNAALGGSASTNLWHSAGTEADVVDGKPETFYAGRGALFSSDWMWVKLQARSQIDRLRVTSPAGCPVEKYVLLTSDQPTPKNPSESSTDWIAVPGGSITAGKGDESVSFAPRDAYHVALIFKATDCSSWTWGYHEVSEIEAWTVADVPPPPEPMPSCAGGGGL